MLGVVDDHGDGEVFAAGDVGEPGVCGDRDGVLIELGLGGRREEGQEEGQKHGEGADDVVHGRLFTSKEAQVFPDGAEDAAVKAGRGIVR